jgi:hypothetical protein
MIQKNADIFSYFLLGSFPPGMSVIGFANSPKENHGFLMLSRVDKFKSKEMQEKHEAATWEPFQLLRRDRKT